MSTRLGGEPLHVGPPGCDYLELVDADPLGAAIAAARAEIDANVHAAKARMAAIPLGVAAPGFGEAP